MSLRFEVKDHIATLTIDRQEALNAMDAEVYRLLSESWITVRDDPEVWVAVITGAGAKSFTVGADLKSRIPQQQQMFELWRTQTEQLLNRGLEVWKPVIAAVNGYCLGGGMTLLFATDIRVAAEHATFAMPEVKSGVIPGNGGTQRALHQLPYPIAMEMMLLGERISAQDALRFGLINKVVPATELMNTAMDYARRLCERPPLTVQAIKELAIRSYGLHPSEGFRMEQLVSSALRQTEDRAEGLKAFAEKRKPQFKGR